ncbi:TetR/AcrR family transcriptional regulator [Fodinicola acaciae]|uniref:TetR/AcrR family transcriptional regulator n=1 Tax=Fodinicola acaciae TaxID=2681555 RepID=UPI0013D54AAF|nr:TetR/AcrR family transcriptional regulator [Fodinicola acaciae]
MPRTKPSEERRADLLDAAEELVLRDGVDALRIDDVTLGAGVAKGTFYLHFKTKDELIAALAERYVQRFVACQREASDGYAGVERIQRWLVAGIDTYTTDNRLHDVLFRHPAHTVYSGHNLAAGDLRDLLVETVDLPDPDATAILLYHALHGAADHVLHTPADRDRIVAELVRLCQLVTARRW